MSNCKPGDKPRIDYKFNGEAGITYQSSVSPIDVVTGTTPFNTTSNYDPRGYQINFNSPQGAYGTIQTVVIDYQIIHISTGPYAGDYIAVIPCGQTSFAKTSATLLGDTSGLVLLANITSPVVINNAVNCPGAVSSGGGTCTLTISSEGKTLFKTQGNCPVTYVVTCGNCPPGTCECHSDTYPGYCCNDCTATSESLQNISNQLKRLKNNG
jgi:hypothetical protein